MRSRPAVTAGGSVREGGWGRQGRAALGVAGCAGGKEEVPLSQAVALRKSNFSFLFFLRGVGVGYRKAGSCRSPCFPPIQCGANPSATERPFKPKGLPRFKWLSVERKKRPRRRLKPNQSHAGGLG